MNETMRLILSLSLSGSILAVLIFSIKPFIKQRLSKSIQYYIWIIVLLRLIIPFSFENSIMNYVFYNDKTSADVVLQSTSPSVVAEGESSISSSILPNVQKNVARGVYNNDTDHSRYFTDLFNQYVLYIWLLGAAIMLAVNLTGYARFSKYLRRENKPATDEQNKILDGLLNGRHKVRLVRNKFVATPMLIGILRPCIVIPDVDFDEKQLKNILLHEILHLKRFDVAVKWLAMIAVSIHWFNPLVYFIKREVNRACELSCDEAVIKNLDSAEKQAYGETLIAVSADTKYPVGVLQATMSEEKATLKERLVAIMKHNKKSKIAVIVSGILLLSVIIGALCLGAGVGGGKNVPPGIYISAEGDMLTYDLTDIAKYKTPYVGNHSKDGQISSRLPLLDKYFKQQYISLQTKEKPYGLTVYYEAASDIDYPGKWPLDASNSELNSNLNKNALVLFCMIGNLDEVTFAFRNSKSDGKLDESKYDSKFTFQRTSFEKQYGDLSALGNNLDSLKKILTEKPDMAPKSIDQAVSQAVKGRQKAYGAGEVATEGHVILETEEQAGIVKAYTISSFGAFGFENGVFTKVSGSGAIPTVMTFSKNKNGEYSLLEYKEPIDGAGYTSSTKKMFPERLWDRVFTSRDGDYSVLRKQQGAQAAEYLKSIGRAAEVSEKYVGKKLADINVDASNKLFSELTKYNRFLNDCPYWLGTREKVENGVRYIYETSQSKTNDGYDLITFKKMKENGSIVEQAKYKIVGNEPELIN